MMAYACGFADVMSIEGTWPSGTGLKSVPFNIVLTLSKLAFRLALMRMSLVELAMLSSLTA